MRSKAENWGRFLSATRDVKASRPVWPHGIWPWPRRNWAHGFKHDINQYLQSSHRRSFLLCTIGCLLKTMMYENWRLLFLKCNDC